VKALHQNPNSNVRPPIDTPLYCHAEPSALFGRRQSSDLNTATSCPRRTAPGTELGIGPFVGGGDAELDGGDKVEVPGPVVVVGDASWFVSRTVTMGTTTVSTAAIAATAGQTSLFRVQNDPVGEVPATQANLGSPIAR